MLCVLCAADSLAQTHRKTRVEPQAARSQTHTRLGSQKQLPSQLAWLDLGIALVVGLCQQRGTLDGTRLVRPDGSLARWLVLLARTCVCVCVFMWDANAHHMFVRQSALHCHRPHHRHYHHLHTLTPAVSASCLRIPWLVQRLARQVGHLANIKYELVALHDARGQAFRWFVELAHTACSHCCFWVRKCRRVKDVH